jgi:hypothetical protein
MTAPNHELGSPPEDPDTPEKLASELMEYDVAPPIFVALIVVAVALAFVWFG